MRSVAMGCVGLWTALLLLGVPRSALAMPVVLKLATVAPEGSAWAALLQRYKTSVERRSGGRLHVELFMSGALGGENELVLKTRRGQIQAASATTAAWATQVPALAVIELPFQFRSDAEADAVIDGALAAPLASALRAADLTLGFWSENGFRHFGLQNGVIHTPADLRGRKMRSQEAPVHVETWRALGAAPVPIAAPEVLTALQHGTVDGFDQALLFAVAANWTSSIRSLTLSGHIYQPALIAFHAPWWQALPPDLQAILLSEGRVIQDLGRRTVRHMTPDLLTSLRQRGVAVVDLTAAQRDAFVQAVLPVRAWFRRTQSPATVAVLDALDAALLRYRAAH